MYEGSQSPTAFLKISYQTTLCINRARRRRCHEGTTFTCVAGLKTKRLPCVHNNSNKIYFKRTTVNPDKSMAMYNKLQIISVTGKENKIIVTRLSTVNRGQYRGMWCIYCCCTKKNREWPGHCYSYQSLVIGL